MDTSILFEMLDKILPIEDVKPVRIECSECFFDIRTSNEEYRRIIEEHVERNDHKDYSIIIW
jgi:hypothetical protein